MSTIYVNRDDRFTNPFDGDVDKFEQWLSRQDDLLRLIHWLGNNGYTFKAHKGIPDGDHIDVIRKALESEPPREPVFVFGSNERGAHGAGAAKHAAIYEGAIKGRGVGYQGNSYAIPTKDRSITTISLAAISVYVKEFVDFAVGHPLLNFNVTRIGCGLAGYNDDQIAPLFHEAINQYKHPITNISLPRTWDIDKGTTSTIFCNTSLSIDEILKKIDDIVNQDTVVDGFKPLDFISGTHGGLNQYGEQYCIEQGYEFTRLPSWIERYTQSAFQVRNNELIRSINHMYSIWDTKTQWTRMFDDQMRKEGIDVRLTILGE